MQPIYFKALKCMPLKDIDHGSGCSDLFLRVTPESQKLVDQYEYKGNVTKFRDQIDHVLWYNIPFAFPYKIFDERGDVTKIWTFSHYNENGEHVYYNGLVNVGNLSKYHKEITVTDFSKYKIYM